PGKQKLQTKQQPIISDGINNNNNKVVSIQQNSIIQPSSHDDLEKNDNINDDELLLQSRRDQSNRASHLIGQYLLKGWALIDQICPNELCYGVPLVKSHDKKKYCVICQNYYINESEYDPSKYNVINSHNTENGTTNVKKHQIDVKEIESTVQQLGKKVEFSFSNTNNVTLRPNDDDIHRHNTMKKCISTLSSKLEELNILLENTSDVIEIKNICNTIESCANALGAIKSLEHS
ncbi:hypothetical protein C1645_791679, partial [Glomus cerebriforme]